MIVLYMDRFCVWNKVYNNNNNNSIGNPFHAGVLDDPVDNLYDIKKSMYYGSNGAIYSCTPKSFDRNYLFCEAELSPSLLTLPKLLLR